MAAINAFNASSSAGLDSLRPAHLKDLTIRSAGEAGARLITALTALRRGSRGWALGRAPTPGVEFRHSKCTIQ